MSGRAVIVCKKEQGWELAVSAGRMACKVGLLSTGYLAVSNGTVNISVSNGGGVSHQTVTGTSRPQFVNQRLGRIFPRFQDLQWSQLVKARHIEASASLYAARG